MTSTTVWLDYDGDAAVCLPVAGKCSDDLAERIAGGQPMALTRGGTAVAVVIDVDSWAEVEAAFPFHPTDSR